MADVAVVGAGVNGLATAWALRRDGHDVVVYEQFELGHERGSSHGRTRIFRLAYPDEWWVRLAVEALDGWRELEAEAGEELLAERAMRAFARGLRIEEHHRVGSLGDLAEPVVVVTAGPWARRLLAPHGIDLPVVETRETVACFRRDGETPSVVAEIVDRGHGFYALADPVHGLKVGSHMRGRPADPDVVEGPDPALVREIADWTAQRFPRTDPEPVEAESCFCTTTDDESFILERHGRIVVGSACSGHGFKFAPAVGKRLAQLAAA